MDVNRIWILIGKKVSGEATQQDIDELNGLLSGRIDNMYPLHELEEMWRSGKTEKRHLSPPQINERWQRFKQTLPENNMPEAHTVPLHRSNSFVRRMRLVAACAVFLIAGAISLVVWNAKSRGEIITARVKAPAGSMSEVRLPDGTKVWLNAGSELTYNKHFGESDREVTLSGEAFFDVVKDASHPFIVTTSSLRLKVLGTAFNVRSFLNDKTSEASLLRGSIEVTLLKNPDKKIVLKPSEKITVRNTSLETKVPTGILKDDQLPLITLSNVHYQELDSLPAEAQWMEKKLVFTSETFEDLALKMERYFNVSIKFHDESLKNLKLSGSFKNESIEDVMKALQFTGNFHYNIKDKQITIYK